MNKQNKKIAPAEDEQKTKPAKKAKDDVDTSAIPDLNDL